MEETVMAVLKKWDAKKLMEGEEYKLRQKLGIKSGEVSLVGHGNPPTIRLNWHIPDYGTIAIDNEKPHKMESDDAARFSTLEREMADSISRRFGGTVSTYRFNDHNGNSNSALVVDAEGYYITVAARPVP